MHLEKLMALNLHCPHCQHPEEDPLELLDENIIDSMKCEACEKVFYFAILDCHLCAHEGAYSWLTEPPAQALTLLTCPACQSTFLRNENSIATELAKFI
jgi:uncharacterized protein YbaR (Trm112 family)